MQFFLKSFLFLCLFGSLYTQASTKNCEYIQYEDIKLNVRWGEAEQYNKLFMIVKDSAVIAKATTLDEFNTLAESLATIGTCNSFTKKELNLSCSPILTKDGYYILSSEFITFTKTIRNPWEEIATELRFPSIHKQCPSFTSWNSTIPHCKLSIKANEENICRSLCDLKIEMSKKNDGDDSTVTVQESLGPLLSRYKIEGLIEDILFLDETRLCDAHISNNRICELSLNEKDKAILSIPGLVKYELDYDILRSMSEVSLGGLCQGWKNLREIKFNSIPEKRYDYLTFSVGDIAQRTLETTKFFDFISDLRKAKVIAQENAANCSLENTEESYLIKRAETIIFRSKAQEVLLETLLALKRNKLCL